MSLWWLKQIDWKGFNILTRSNVVFAGSNLKCGRLCFGRSYNECSGLDTHLLHASRSLSCLSFDQISLRWQHNSIILSLAEQCHFSKPFSKDECVHDSHRLKLNNQTHGQSSIQKIIRLMKNSIFNLILHFFLALHRQ